MNLLTEKVLKLVLDSLDDVSLKKLSDESSLINSKVYYGQDITKKQNTKNTITNTSKESTTIEIKNMDGLQYLSEINKDSVDLILTDPPYIISRNSGMNTLHNKIKDNEQKQIKYVKTEKEWVEYKQKYEIKDDQHKELFLKHGTVYGKKYATKTQFGNWDTEFTMDQLEKFVELYYQKLRKGGTLIIFFDLWKISYLKEILEKYKFKGIRYLEWIKTNPPPINSKVNYLTNSREIALLGVKSGKPTFNSSHDNGIYSFPIQGGKNRFHPTQKNLKLFEALIQKHSREGDLVLDTFAGSATTMVACKNVGRNFKGCEISKEYFDKINEHYGHFISKK